MDQSTWNLLFGWMTDGQCMIPEGCPPPLEGVAFYAILILAVAGGVYWLRENPEKIPEW